MVVKSNSDTDSIIYKFERVPSSAGCVGTTWEELMGSYEAHTGTHINQECVIIIVNITIVTPEKKLEKQKKLNWDFPKPHSIV